MKEEKRRIKNAITALVLSIILAIVIFVTNYIYEANKVVFVPEVDPVLIKESTLKNLQTQINEVQTAPNVSKINMKTATTQINKKSTKTSPANLDLLKEQINKPQQL